MISENIKTHLPTVIKAKYKIITPMFIGDADQKASWISPMSFKGALRFWWRALAWNCFQGESEETILKNIHQQEAILFGDTESGKGLVSVKLTPPETLSASTGNFKGHKYLAYGLTGDKQNSPREAIASGLYFDIQLQIESDITTEQRQQLENALIALGLFGGLGSRARRANGAISLINLNNEDYIIKDREDYLQKANKVLQGYSKKLPPYSAFSDKTLFSVSSKLFDKEELAHKALGAVYQNYRGQPSSLRGACKKVFGLPLKGVDENARRGSPLFFHIVELQNTQFVYSVLYLPTSIFHKDRKHYQVENELVESFVKQIGE